MTASEPARPTILLIEDDRDICEVIVDVLSDEGFEIVAVGNGAEGLKRLRSEDVARA